MGKSRERLDLALQKLEERYDEMLSEPALSSFHCALIYSGGALLSIGFNRAKVNSFVTTFAHHDFVQSVHAECDAILRARKKIDLRDSRMYVVKLGRNRDVGNSKPCLMCEKALAMYGVKRVYYTTDAENFDSVKVSSFGDAEDASIDD